MNRYTGKTLLLEITMVVLAIVFAIPFYLIVNVAFQSPNTTGSGVTFSWPPNFDNVQIAWVQGGLGAAILNSVVVTVISTFCVIAVSSLASYYLARTLSRVSRAWNIAFLLGLMLPLQLATLPLYAMIRDLGLLGTVWSLVLVYSAMYLPFSIFLYVLFIRALPIDFEEAAQLDGCGPLRVFWHIALPLTRPVTITIAILVGIAIYNDFFTPLLYLAGSGQETAPVAINAFVSQYSTPWPVVFAGLLLLSIPILAAFFALQKQVIGGFAGGLKG